MNDLLADRLAGFRGVSLAQLDERAALLSRVDTKYAVDRRHVLELQERLRGDLRHFSLRLFERELRSRSANCSSAPTSKAFTTVSCT